MRERGGGGAPTVRPAARLVKRVNMVFSRLSRDTMTAACGKFRSWLKAVVVAEGGYFE